MFKFQREYNISSVNKLKNYQLMKQSLETIFYTARIAHINDTHNFKIIIET